jgi:CSLREA domain-containing protein
MDMQGQPDDARARADKEERELSGRKLTAGIGAALGAAALFAPAANAATFTVDNLTDGDDGACDDGDCSLREAADEANLAADADTINFASGLSGTIELTDTDGDIPLLAETTITGPGAGVLTVSGEGNYRIFYAKPDDVGAAYDAVTISGLTLANGDASKGGALYSYESTLTLADMVFTNNDAGSAGAVYANDTPFTILNSTFTGNEAADNAGALYSEGSGAGNAPNGDLVIRNTTFANNTSLEAGGAVDLSGDDPDGNVTIENSTFSGNVSTDGIGGGVYLDETDEEGRLTIRNSTFSGNVAFYGGGAYVSSPEDGFVIENSTFSGNTAQYNGGALFLHELEEDEVRTIRNTTITGNQAGLNPNNYVTNPYGGGGIYLEDTADDPDDEGPVDISSSIVANNTGVDFGPDLGQGEFAEGFNVASSLIENPADALINATGPNLTGVDPQLGPLADNGGPTKTHAPSVGSPVIDAGVANGLATDQRGVQRTFDAANVPNVGGSDGTDVGSVELLPGGRLAVAQCKGRAENVLFAPGTEIVGSNAGDVIVGTDAKDNIKSGKGKDLVCAEGGNDSLKAGSGKDKAFGAAGKDKLKGNGGNDKLSGQGGKDTLKGGGGKDTLKGGGGKDKLRGGPGKDKLKGGAGKDSEVQ